MSIFLSVLIAASVVSAQITNACLSSANVQCFNQLEQIQSLSQCGPASLSFDGAMGHMMPKDDSWMDCACGKLPAIIECLDTSNCATFKKLADDFAGVVMHCGMPDHKRGSSKGSDDKSNKGSDDSSATGSSATASGPTPSQTQAVSGAVVKFRAPALCGLCLLALV